MHFLDFADGAVADELHGDESVETLLAGSIHHAHAPGAQPGDDLKAFGAFELDFQETRLSRPVLTSPPKEPTL